jgi:hypothetical protein
MGNQKSQLAADSNDSKGSTDSDVLTKAKLKFRTIFNSMKDAYGGSQLIIRPTT